MAKPSPEEAYAYDGLANLANSIRRSTALTVAMNMTPPPPEDATPHDLHLAKMEMLDLADEMVVWLRGKVGAAEDQAPEEPPSADPGLGVSWHDRDQV